MRSETNSGRAGLRAPGPQRHERTMNDTKDLDILNRSATVLPPKLRAQLRRRSKLDQRANPVLLAKVVKHTRVYYLIDMHDDPFMGTCVTTLELGFELGYPVIPLSSLGSAEWDLTFEPKTLHQLEAELGRDLIDPTHEGC